MTGDAVKDAAREASTNPIIQRGARLGYAVSGVLHLLIAWIALQVAWSASAKKADQSGALQTLAQNGFGIFVLWVAVVGFALLCLWHVAEAVVGRTSSPDWKDRLKAVGKAVVYAVLAYSALKFASGSGSSSGKQTVDATADLMSHSVGRILVGIVGLVIIVVGGYHVYKGATKRFLRDLRGLPGRWATELGRYGYIAKGIALGVVGLLFVIAAARKQPSKASGLDGALRTLKDQPLGPWLLTAIAVGIAAYGVYSFARARYARV